MDGDGAHPHVFQSHQILRDSCCDSVIAPQRVCTGQLVNVATGWATRPAQKAKESLPIAPSIWWGRT
jgi:hypothetical protein